jgi:hypothetical protein
LWRHHSITEIVTTALGAAAVAVVLGAVAEAHEHGFRRSDGGRTVSAASGDDALSAT